MARLFGTDGVRGIANIELSCELAYNIARAAAMVAQEELGYPATVLVGTDTRISGDMFRAAVQAGLVSVGATAVDLRVVPTPAVAYLVVHEQADLGIMISASHNPFEFNGIKIFGAQGYKLTDEQELLIERIILDDAIPYATPWGDAIGSMIDGSGMVADYTAHLRQTVEGYDFTKFRIALDCSHGSASQTAKQLFGSTGAKITVLNAQPNGRNINDGVGSTHLEFLADKVRNGNYDAGFAFDGDADRCLMVDEAGNIVDGDVIMAILALYYKNRNQLADNTLVATIMSNMGLFQFAKEHGITVTTTKVGDRYVLKQMLKDGSTLGGEQSGHVILSDYMTSGDGQLTALQVMAALASSGKRASELAAVMTVYPQAMTNMKADKKMKEAVAVDKGAQEIIRKAEEVLGESGRILVRPSGTEPLIRVMAEGKDQAQLQRLVEQVADDLEERLTLIQTSM